MNEVDEMYWAVCPKCGGKMLKIQTGRIETICTNTDCKAKWRITVQKFGIIHESKLCSIFALKFLAFGCIG